VIFYGRPIIIIDLILLLEDLAFHLPFAFFPLRGRDALLPLFGKANTYHGRASPALQAHPAPKHSPRVL